MHEVEVARECARGDGNGVDIERMASGERRAEERQLR